MANDVELTGDRELDRTLQEMPAKLQRGALRPAVSAGATKLVQATRDEIKATPFEDSRGSTAARRKSAKEAGQLPLVRTIGKRAWSVPEKGIIGQVVGPTRPAGAHGHLVHEGHRIVTTRKAGHRDTGRRTEPIPFQRRAEEKAKQSVLLAIAAKARAWLAKRKVPMT